MRVPLLLQSVLKSGGCAVQFRPNTKSGGGVTVFRYTQYTLHTWPYPCTVYMYMYIISMQRLTCAVRFF